MRWTALLMAFACAPVQRYEQSPLEQRSVAAVLETWDLGVPDESCRVDEARIAFPETREDYLAVCPDHSWACLRWAWDDGRVAAVPIAVIHPGAPHPDRLAVHELLHAMGRCTSRWDDVYDYTHQDSDVWVRVEGAAKAAL